MPGRVLLGRAWVPLADAAALLDTLQARTYKRDRDGKFSSGGGGGSEGEAAGADATVVGAKTLSGEGRLADGEADLAVVRDADGNTRLHIGFAAEGSIEGQEVALDHAGARELQQALTDGAASARVLQKEVNALQSEADRIDGEISKIDQKTIGARTEHGYERLPLSAADQAERDRLSSRWDELDERIGGLEGGDGEVAAHGVIRGQGGDIHL